MTSKGVPQLPCFMFHERASGPANKSCIKHPGKGRNGRNCVLRGCRCCRCAAAPIPSFPPAIKLPLGPGVHSVVRLRHSRSSLRGWIAYLPVKSAPFVFLLAALLPAPHSSSARLYDPTMGLRNVCRNTARQEPCATAKQQAASHQDYSTNTSSPMHVSRPYTHPPQQCRTWRSVWHETKGSPTATHLPSVVVVPRWLETTSHRTHGQPCSEEA